MTGKLDLAKVEAAMKRAGRAGTSGPKQARAGQIIAREAVKARERAAEALQQSTLRVRKRK